MTQSINRLPPQERRRKRPKGWTRERRARQAVLIRAWKPWTRSTGPKTARGKAVSAMNALVHGGRSQQTLAEERLVRATLRRCREFTDLVFALCRELRRRERAFVRNSSAPPRVRGDKFVANAGALAQRFRC